MKVVVGKLQEGRDVGCGTEQQSVFRGRCRSRPETVTTLLVSAATHKVQRTCRALGFLFLFFFFESSSRVTTVNLVPAGQEPKALPQLLLTNICF